MSEIYNEYYFDVDFETGKIRTNLKELVQNDYNSTKINFTFNKDGRFVFKMLYPDGGTVYVTDINNNELILEPGVLSHAGDYEIEIAVYNNNGKLTNRATRNLYVREELIKADGAIASDDRLPILDELINAVDNIDIDVSKVDNVATVSVTKKDGTEKSVEIYDGASGVPVFEIENGHLFVISGKLEDCESYAIGVDGHLYLEMGE